MPRSKEGGNFLSNYALASRTKNELRGNKPLKDFTTPQKVIRYLAQFLDVKLPHFDGNEYIKGIIETLKELKVL